MARLAKRELESIIARDMPGYKLARQNLSDERFAPADQVAPDIDVLQEKYLGASDNVTDGESTSGNPGGSSNTANIEAAEDTGDQIVAVEPAKPDRSGDGPARPKTVVVSGKSKRIIGRQG